MSETRISVRIQVTTQKIRKELHEILCLAGDFHIQGSSDMKACDLLIMEIGDRPETDFKCIDEIKNSGRVGEIFLTSKDTNPDILLKALKMGVREFLPQPIDKKEVLDALLKFKERKEHQGRVKTPKKKGKIIDILGSKGGVGTTTVVVNLATCLVNLEGIESVALIDMNLLFGEVSTFLGIKPAFDWIEIVKNISRLDGTYLRSTLFKHSSGIYVLPSAGKLTDEYRPTPQVIETILVLMRTMFDFVVIDSGHCLDEVALEALKISDMVLLIAESNLPCLINVKKILSIFRDLGYPPENNIKIIMNRFHKNSLISLKEAQQSINAKFMCNIPNDYHLTSKAINQGKPLYIMDQKSEISKCFRDLSISISGKKQKKKRGFFTRKLLK